MRAKRTRSDSPLAGQDMDERRAARQIRSLLNRMRTVKYFYLVPAVALALILLLLLLMVATGYSLPQGMVVPVVVLVVLFGLLVVVIRQLGTRPLFWTLLMALVVTGLLGLEALWRYNQFGALNLGRHLPYTLATVLYFWTAVGMAWSIRRILREHPDMRVSRTLVAEGGVLKRVASDTEGSKAERKLKAAAARRRNQLLAVLGVSLGVVLILMVVLGEGDSSGTANSSTAQFVGPTVCKDEPLEFRRIWQAEGDGPQTSLALSKLAKESMQRKTARALRIRFKKLGWTQKRPALGEPRMEKVEGRYWLAHFPMEGVGREDPFTTTWIWDRTKWVLRRYRWPEEIRARLKR